MSAYVLHHTDMAIVEDKVIGYSMRVVVSDPR